MRCSGRSRIRPDHLPPPTVTLLLPVCTLAVLLGVTACSQGQATGPTSPTQLRRAADVSDSVRPAVRLLAAATQTIPIKKGESALIAVVSADCAAQGDVVSVSGALSGTIGTDVCHVIPPPVTLGPATQDGQLLFQDSGPWGTGGTLVSGSYPNYTVSMGDGYGDNDYNDAVLTCTILGNLCPPTASADSIDAFLAREHSPMAGEGADFVAAGKKYDVDPRLLVAIAGAETQSGKPSQITRGQYNAFNWQWNHADPHHSSFSSWNEAIVSVAHGMSPHRKPKHYDLTNTTSMYLTGKPHHYCTDAKGSTDCEDHGIKNVNRFVREQKADSTALENPCKRS